MLFVSGEANAGYNRDEYNCSFPAMIDDWRMAFHEGSDGQTALDFPFGFVQVLLNRDCPLQSQWEELDVQLPLAGCNGWS